MFIILLCLIYFTNTLFINTIKMATKINKSKTHMKKFGPNLSESKPIEMKCGQIKKLIHYDCNTKKINSIEECEIPDENEIYVKENLLQPSNEDNENN